MPKVVFTQNLKRHIDCPDQSAVGSTVREVLENVFRAEPSLRGYVLDDQGALRGHVVIFVDDSKIRDRRDLSDHVSNHSEVFVMQALSGG